MAAYEKTWYRYSSVVEYGAIAVKMTWNEAESACKAKGATMLIVTSKQHGEDAFRWVGSQRFWSESEFWLGLKRNSGTFIWSDGSSFKYANWKPGKLASHNCVIMKRRAHWEVSNKWETMDCNKKFPVICQRKSRLKIFSFYFYQINFYNF